MSNQDVYQISQTNPTWWNLSRCRSKYTEAEILKAFEDVEAINAEWVALVNHIYDDILTDEHGEMSRISGYASKAHEKLHQATQAMDGEVRVSVYYERVDHTGNSVPASDTYPVYLWRKDIERLRRDISKLKKLAAKF